MRWLERGLWTVGVLLAVWCVDLTTSDRLYRYRVSKTFIVNPQDVYVLDPGAHPMLTLVTCYPFEFIGHAPQRHIVHALLVAEETRAGQAGG